VFLGASLEQVAEAYIQQQDQPAAATDDVVSGVADDSAVSSPPALDRHKLPLQPSDTARSRGAHLYASNYRSTRRDRAKGIEYVIAVQCINRWEPEDAAHRYALAVVLERDAEHGELYLDLQAQLEARVALEAEVEL
jgi:hypothetical protein